MTKMACLFGLLLSLTASAFAQSDITFRWPKGAFPLRVVVDQSIEAEVWGYGPAESLFQEWHRDSRAPLFQYPITSRPDSRGSADVRSYVDGVNGVHISRTWFAQVNPNALSVVYYVGNIQVINGRRIVWVREADVFLNYRYFRMSSDTTDMQTYYTPRVMLRALGHFLGMVDDPSNVESAMYPFFTQSNKEAKSSERDLWNLNYVLTSDTPGLKIERLPNGEVGVWSAQY
jgi:hypothetical protein